MESSEILIIVILFLWIKCMDRKVDSNYYLAPQKFAAMEEERKHIENIFYARFNYFILFFTLFLSIEVTIYSEKNILERDKWIILTALSFLGFVISLLISITLYRIRRALEVTLKYRDYNSITARLIRRKLGKRKKG